LRASHRRTVLSFPIDQSIARFLQNGHFHENDDQLAFNIKYYRVDIPDTVRDILNDDQIQAHIDDQASMELDNFVNNLKEIYPWITDYEMESKIFFVNQMSEHVSGLSVEPISIGDAVEGVAPTHNPTLRRCRLACDLLAHRRVNRTPTAGKREANTNNCEPRKDFQDYLPNRM